MFQTTNQWGLIWVNIEVVYQWPHIDTSGPSGRDPESSCRQDSPLQAWLGKSAADLRDWSRKLLALILLPSITQWPSMAYWNPFLLMIYDMSWCWNLRCPIFQSRKIKFQTLGSLGNPSEAPAALMIAPPGATMNFRWNSSVDIVRNALARKQFQLQGSAEETWHYETRDAWAPISRNSGVQIL